MFPQIIPYACLGYFLGVALGSAFSPIGEKLIFLIGGICVGLFIFCRLNYFRFALIFFIMLLAGTIFSDLTVRRDQLNLTYWKNYAAAVTKFEGRVQSVEEDGLTLKVLVDSVRLIEKNGAVLPGVLEIKTAVSENIHDGDLLQFIGKIKVPDDFSLGKGHFDPRRYYARYGIFATMVNPRIRVLSSGTNGLLTGLRNNLRYRFQILLPEPAAGLFSATLLGFMRDVPKSLRTDFSNSGLAHLVAISGQHVGMLAVAVFFIAALLGLPRNLAMLISATLALLFIALVDFPPSGIRSVIMAGAVYWAYSSGRKPQGFRILLIAVTAMLAINPRILLADLGFQLSVLAMWGLLVFYPLTRRVYWKINPLGIREIFLMSVCAIVITAPIIAYSFGRISVIGLLANIFAAPLYPLLMLFGLLVLIFGGIPFLQGGLLLATDLLTKIFLAMVQFSAKLPGANIEIKEFSAKYVVLFYGSLFVLSLILSRGTRRQFWPIADRNGLNKKLIHAEQQTANQGYEK